MTWVEFTNVFCHNYFLEMDHEKMAKDFNNLKKDIMVADYATKFIQLSHYATDYLPRKRGEHENSNLDCTQQY